MKTTKRKFLKVAGLAALCPLSVVASETEKLWLKTAFSVSYSFENGNARHGIVVGPTKPYGELIRGTDVEILRRAVGLLRLTIGHVHHFYGVPGYTRIRVKTCLGVGNSDVDFNKIEFSSFDMESAVTVKQRVNSGLVKNLIMCELLLKYVYNYSAVVSVYRDTNRGAKDFNKLAEKYIRILQLDQFPKDELRVLT